MKCPECGLMDEANRVIDSRPFKNTIRRRRECSECKHRWNTYEVTEAEFSSARIPKKNTGWGDGERRTLVRMRQQGMSIPAIAEVLGRTAGSVRRQNERLMASGEYFEFMNELEGKEHAG